MAERVAPHNQAGQTSSRSLLPGKLVASLVAVNLIVTVLVAATLLRSKEHYEQRATITTRNIALILDEHLSGVVEKIDIALLSITDEAERQLTTGAITPAALNSHIQRAHQRLPELVALRATTPSGDAIYGVAATPAKTVSLAHRDYFRYLRDTPAAGLVISKPLIGGISGKWMVVMARRINKPDGSFAGLVYAGVALDYLTSDFSRINVGTHGAISLFDANFALIARHPQAANTIGQNSSAPRFRAAITSGVTSGTYNAASSIDGIQRKYSYQTLKLKTPLYVTVGLAEEDYLADWYRELWSMCLFVAAFLTATSLTSWLFYRQWNRSRQAELAAAKSNTMFRTYVENANDVIYSMTTNGELLYVSPNCYEALGYHPHELIGHLFATAMHPDDLAEAWQALRTLLINNTRQNGLEFRFIHRNGEIRWMSVNTSAVIGENAAEPVIYCNAHDITGRKQFEEAVVNMNHDLENRIAQRTAEVCEANAILSAVIDTMSDWVWETSPDGTYRSCSPRVTACLGYLPEELLGVRIAKLLDPDSREQSVILLQSLTERPERFHNLELMFLTKDGQRRLISSNGVPIFDSSGALLCYRGVSTDITEQRQAEDELRQTKSRLEAMINALPDLMFRITVDGRILEFRAASTDDLYIKPELFLGKTFRDVLPAPVATIIHEALAEAAVTGGHRGAAYALEMPEGIRWFELSMSAMTASDKEQQFIMLARDITERREAELAIRLSEQRLNKAQEIAHIGCWELDLTTNQLYWSDEVYRIFGLEQQPFPATYEAFLAAVHPDDRDDVNSAYSVSIRDNLDEYEIAHRIVRPRTGAIRYVHEKCYHERNEDGEIIRSIGVVHDITERKLIESALNESNERFLTMFYNAPAMMAISSLETGCFLDVNRRFSEVTGFGRDDVIGRTFVELGLIEADEMTELLQIVTERGRVYDREIVSQSLDGTQLIGMYSAQLINVGGTRFLLSTAVDITELRQAEQQLRHAQKMESIGRLAGGIAHDFNNKLSVIMGYTELARFDYPDTSQLFGYLTEISRAAEHSRDITAQLLAFSRQQLVSPRIIDINCHLEYALKSLGYLLGEHITIIFCPATALWPVKIDPVQIEQIIMNLAINARDAMPDGGTLTIATDNLTADDSARSDLPRQDYVMITVTDTGTGMEPSVLNRIFDPFFTTKEPGKGTGLGLATIHGIIAQNSGSIEVTSVPGQGSTFRVLLPRTELYPATSENQSTSQGEPADTSANILLVEDDVTVRTITATILERYGYLVHSCATAGEAITVCETSTTDIDLILTDIIMPEMNGREMVAHIRAFNNRVKVIYMSGYSSDIAAQGNELPENIHFIQKPLDMNEVHRKIKELLRS